MFYQKYLKALKLVVGVVFMSYLLDSSLAKAEWDWNDSEYLRNTFTSFVESRFLDENLPGDSVVSIPPERCIPLKFGYQGAWGEDLARRYQVAFGNISLECWERLKQVMPQTPFKIRGVETVTGIDFFPFADSGPSVLFKFDKVASPTAN